MVPAERSVTVAIGHGKRAARNIDAWLSGRRPGARRTAGAGRPSTRLNTWYYADAPRSHRPLLEPVRRASRPSTRWCRATTSPPRSIEARRCLSCGNCFGCDNCYGVCPDNAVIKLGPPGETT